jgi:aminopeptidase N
MTQFLIEDVQPVMEIDAGVSSHPIVVNVTNPDEINEVFDKISYSKGAAVIRMLESMMGKTAFFQVLTTCIGRESRARLSIKLILLMAIGYMRSNA